MAVETTRTAPLGLALTLCMAGLSLGQSSPGSRPPDARWGDLPHTNTMFTPAEDDSSDLSMWQTHRDRLRDQVRLAAGLIPEPPRAALEPRIFGKLQREGYSIEKVYFRSAPGIYVTGNLYRPAAAQGRRPAVACPHGHWRDGRLHHDETGSIPARCITLARAGAVVFAYDMVGYNDSARRFKHGDKVLDSAEAALWGIGHLQFQTFNSIRVIDFLQSLPDVDPERIGVTGASGGGTQTFILGAVDDRIAVDCPVNMISSTMQGGCICENAPLLRIGTNNMEIAALFAPRPRLMVSATGDWTKLTPTVEFPFIRGIYELYGASDRLENVHVDAPHNYNLQSREAMYRFFGRWLLKLPDPAHIKETSFPVEKRGDMLVFDDASTPADMATAEELVRLTREQIRGRMAACTPTTSAKLDELTGMIRLWGSHALQVFGVGYGTSELTEQRLAGPAQHGTQFTLSYAHLGRRVNAASIVPLSPSVGGPRQVVFIVDPDGLAAVRKHGPLVDALARLGQQVTFLEPFGTGARRRDVNCTQPSGEHKFFTTFNPTDDAEVVYDILTAIDPARYRDAAVEYHGAGYRIRLIGFGRMGPLCLAARAMIPQELSRACDLRVLADLDGRDWSADATYVDQCFIPQVQRFGGLPAIAAVAANGPLWLHNTGGGFDDSWVQAARKLTGADVRITAEKVGFDDMMNWLTWAQ